MFEEQLTIHLSREFANLLGQLYVIIACIFRGIKILWCRSQPQKFYHEILWSLLYSVQARLDHKFLPQTSDNHGINKDFPPRIILYGYLNHAYN